ncbi:MAG: ABC transporter ATP-binding protein [Bacteroidaceae bacterium]|nr:ABC transporter ATP-binding protein [Bacteroidaceae bacterium]
MISFQKSSKIFDWLWRTSKGFRRHALLNILIGLLLVGADLLFVYITKLTIDIATKANHSFDLTTAIILLAVVMLTQVSLGISYRWISATLGARALNRMQRKIFAQILDADWAKLKLFHTGDITNRLQKDTSEITRFIVEQTPSFVTTVAKLIGAFFMLYAMDSRLAIIIIFLLPVFYLISRIFVKQLRKITHEVRQTESKIQGIIQETFQHVLVIKTLMVNRLIADNMQANQQQLENQIKHKTVYTSLTATLLNLGFATGYFISFFWGTLSLYEGVITYGSMIAFIQLVGQIQSPIRSLAHYVPTFINISTSVERLNELQDIPTVNTQGTALTGKIGIKIKDLQYTYEGKPAPTINALNLNIDPGQKVAILGKTGSGKTTLIRLLLSLINPQHGHIKIFTDTEERNVTAATRVNFAYLPQGNTLLSGSILENLKMAKPDAEMDEIVNALTMAHAQFVLDLPNGLETTCGEGGHSLSEGQAQRICIARTILRNAPILIFDEATSALDVETEKQIINNLAQHFSNKTIIFITHRLALLDICDQVIELEKVNKKG